MSSSGDEPPAPRLVLDTSAYSHLRRGDDRLIDAVAAAEIVLVPAIVVGELEAGFRMGSRYGANRRSLDELLAEAYVQVVDVDLEIARRYGSIFGDLRRAGTPMPTNDIWIAATALARGAQLVTYDSDFERVAGLPLARFAP